MRKWLGWPWISRGERGLEVRGLAFAIMGALGLFGKRWWKK